MRISTVGGGGGVNFPTRFYDNPKLLKPLNVFSNSPSLLKPWNIVNLVLSISVIKANVMVCSYWKNVQYRFEYTIKFWQVVEHLLTTVQLSRLLLCKIWRHVSIVVRSSPLTTTRLLTTSPTIQTSDLLTWYVTWFVYWFTPFARRLSDISKVRQ